MLKKIDVSPETKEYVPYLRVKNVNGKPYLYEITDTYNTVTKKKKQRSKYIRKILPHEDLKNITKEPLPLAVKPPKLRQLVSYGDSYLFHTLIEETGLKKTLLKCFQEEDVHFLLLLIAYRLLSGDAVSHPSSGKKTDLINQYPYEKSLSSQAISKSLTQIGESAEETIPNFFLHWSQRINKEGESLLFDLTSFTSQLTKWKNLNMDMLKTINPILS